MSHESWEFVVPNRMSSKRRSIRDHWRLTVKFQRRNSLAARSRDSYGKNSWIDCGPITFMLLPFCYPSCSIDSSFQNQVYCRTLLRDLTSDPLEGTVSQAGRAMNLGSNNGPRPPRLGFQARYFCSRLQRNLRTANMIKILIAIFGVASSFQAVAQDFSPGNLSRIGELYSRELPSTTEGVPAPTILLALAPLDSTDPVPVLKWPKPIPLERWSGMIPPREPLVEPPRHEYHLPKPCPVRVCPGPQCPDPSRLEPSFITYPDPMCICVGNILWLA